MPSIETCIKMFVLASAVAVLGCTAVILSHNQVKVFQFYYNIRAVCGGAAPC